MSIDALNWLEDVTSIQMCTIDSLCNNTFMSLLLDIAEVRPSPGFQFLVDFIKPLIKSLAFILLPSPRVADHIMSHRYIKMVDAGTNYHRSDIDTPMHKRKLQNLEWLLRVGKG